MGLHSLQRLSGVVQSIVLVLVGRRLRVSDMGGKGVVSG
jgi:hypothetical protein